MTDPATARSGDKARLDAREREALRQRAEDADGWQMRAEKAEAELAALAAARLAQQQELADVIGKLERTEAALWKESEHRNTVVERLHAAEAAVTALRQELEAIVEQWRAHAKSLESNQPGIAPMGYHDALTHTTQTLRNCARDLADRLARLDPPNERHDL